MSIWKDAKPNKEHEKLIAGYTYEEWEKIKRQFERDYQNSTKYNKSFGELIAEIFENDTYMDFVSKTGLSPNMFYRLKKQVSEKDQPQRNTLISVCIGYDLDIMMTQSLLYSLGLDFNRHSKRDYAYTLLLTRCRGKDIDECNEILKNLGIEKKYWLGVYARKKKE